MSIIDRLVDPFSKRDAPELRPCKYMTHPHHFLSPHHVPNTLRNLSGDNTNEFSVLGQIAVTKGRSAYIFVKLTLKNVGNDSFVYCRTLSQKVALSKLLRATKEIHRLFKALALRTRSNNR